jgi:hypothetical protein
MEEELINNTDNFTPSVNNDFTPKVEEVKDIDMPNMELFPSPYGGNTTSDPSYGVVGVSRDSISNFFTRAKENALNDPFVQAQRFETPSIPGYEGAKQSRNFEKIGIFPGLNVEETYGNAETNWDKLVTKGLIGGSVLAVKQFTDQLTSWKDTIGMFSGDNPFKQSELEAINQWQNTYENKYHIFQTQEDRNTFFNISNLANTIQQSGYAIGAVLEMAAEEYALSALTAATFGGTSEIQAARTLQLASRIGKVAARTREVEKTLQNTNVLRKIFNSGAGRFINPLAETTEFITGFNKLRRADELAFGSNAVYRTTARGFGAFYGDLRMINAGITEAKSTVAPTMVSMYDAAIEDYKSQNNGAEPSEGQKEKLKKEAFKSVQVEGAVQAVFIALTDRVAFDGVLKNFKATRFLDDGLAAKGIFKNTESAIKAGEEYFVEKEGIKAFVHQLKISPFKTLAKEPIKYFQANFMEGIQEVGQDVIDRMTTDWYLNKYGTDKQRLNAKTFNDYLYAGAKQQVSMDGLKTFMSAFLTGGILNVLGGGIRKIQAKADELSDIDGYKDSLTRASEERSRLTSTLNSLISDKGNFYRSLVELNSSMYKNAKDGRKKEYWDYRNEFMNKYVPDLVKSGMDEVIIDRLKEATSELTPEEFKEAFSGSILENISVEEAKKTMTSYLHVFENKVKEVKETYSSIQDNYGNPYNPSKYKKGTKEYNDEVANYIAANEAIDQIAFSKSTYMDIAKRQKDILNSIKTYMPNMSFNSLYAMTSPEITLKKETELLKKEIETIQDPELKKQKQDKLKLLDNYKNIINEFVTKIDKAGDNIEEHNKIKNEFIKNHTNLITSILKVDNEDISATLTNDKIATAVNDIYDYLRLQTDFEDAVSYFNIIANPVNFEGLHQSHLKELFNIINKPKEETEEDDANKKTVEIEVIDKNGKPHKITLIEGNEFITETNPTKRVMRKSGKVITTHDQDIIKINSLDLDNKTVTVTINNDEESITYPLDEFAKSIGKLWNLNKMDEDAALYFRNRDRVIVIKVNKSNGLLHRIDGDNAKKDYSSNSVEVFAMIKYEKDPDDPKNKILFFDYKTKDGKRHTVPFDINYYKKYGVKTDKKYLLNLSPTVEQYLKEKSQQKKLNAYNKQVQIFELLIKEQEQKSGPREQRKKEIDKQIDQIKIDLEEAEEYIKLANQEIDDVISNKKKLNSKQKKQLASLKELITEYNNKLTSLKQTNGLLNAEKIEIEKELKVFEELSETYYTALDEIKKTGTPFYRSGKTQTIYGEEEERLQEIENQRTTSYIEIDDFERVLNSLNLEKNDIDNKLKVVEDTIQRVEKLISRFTKYDDIINAIVGTDPTSNRSKKELQTALVKLKTKESSSANPNTEKIELINNLLSGLNTRFKGFDNQVFGKEILEAISFVNLFSIATKEKQKLEDQLNFVSKEIEDISKGKEYIEKNIIPVKQKIEYLKKIENILLEGQAKLLSLNLIEATKKSVKGPTTEAADEFKGYSDIMDYEEITSLDNADDDIILLDHDRVKFLNALFKTAGRHYKNSGDAQRDNIALTPEQDRFFTFTSNSIIAGENYFLIPITENNDKYGIIQKSYVDNNNNTVEVKDDVKLIVVKKVAGEYVPIDKYGNVLSEDQQTKDNLVFNSMVNTVELMQDDVDAAIKWLRSEANDKFTITKNKIGANGVVTKEEYTDEELKNELNTFKKFRNGIIKDIKEGKVVDPLKIERKSIGKQRREVLDVTTGRPQELPLQGRLLEENPDFSTRGELKHPDGSPITLRVSTKNSGISNTIKQGRMVMQKGDTFYQVYNRRINEDEINNTFDVILALLPMFGRRWLSKERIQNLTELYNNKIITLDRFTELTKKLTPEEEKQFDLGLKYLLHTLYWSQVKEGGKVGNKQFYIKGDSLYVGEKGYKFEIDGELNLQNIIESKDEIMNFIKKDDEGNIISKEPMFHSVNSGSISKKDNKFVTAKVVDGQIVKNEEFKNYLEYLLSNKNDRTPIVYTNIVKYNKDEPQLANSYLIYNRPKEENPVPPKPKEEPKTGTATEEEITEESLLELPLDLNNIPKNEKIVIRKKFGSTKKIVDFYGTWDGNKFVIEKAFNITDNKDSTSIILEKVPTTITESIKNVNEYKNSNDPQLKKIYTDLLSDFVSISKITEQKKKIIKQDTSSIKSDIEALIRMGKIEFVDDTTNVQC